MPIKREASYIGLVENARSRYDIIDRDPISRDFFEITEFPEILTAGKNVFKFRGNPDNLVDNCQIYFEILDYNGDPVYYEVLNFEGKDGVRILSIWIFKDTPEGVATLYLAGRAAVDPKTGKQLPYSYDMNSPDYKEYPNVLWTRSARIAPNKRNSSEIIFLQQPQVTVSEEIKTFAQITDLPSFYKSVSGSATGTSVGGYSTTAATTNASTNPYLNSAVTQAVLASVGSSNTVSLTYGTSLPTFSTPGGSNVTTGTSTTYAPVNLGQASAAGSTSAPIIQFSQPNTTLITTTGMPLTASVHMQALVAINRPRIIASADHQVGDNPQISDSYGRIIHHADTSVATIDAPGNFSGTEINTTHVAHIVDVINSTTARISPAFSFLSKRTSTPAGFQLINFVSSPITMSYWEPEMTGETENSMSFAKITLSNMEPATGDIYSIRTLYKLMGSPGDYIDAGQTILEKYDVLRDTGSNVPTIQMGVQDRKLGQFWDQTVIDTYWQTNENTTAVWDNDIVGESVKLTYTASGFTQDDHVRFELKPQYHQTLFAGTTYTLQFFHKAIATGSMDFISTTGAIPVSTEPARIDVYISGSTLHSDKQHSGLIKGAPLNGSRQAFTDTSLGNYVGTVETSAGGNISRSTLQFVPLETAPCNLIFVVRKSEWHLTNISLTANIETGFSPNFARITIRIPTDAMYAPLAFKFQYLDYQGSPADLETFVQGAIFDGDNTYITGEGNLLSGSIFIGNSVGSGIELAGVNSAFIRSIGYMGFTSGSRAIDPRSGFMIYSGSVLPDSGDNYVGVGVELVSSADSYLRYRTNADGLGNGELDVRTQKFFLGSSTSFISGSGDGTIAISSSNFELTNTGDVTMQGTITATAGGTIGGATIESASLAFAPYWRISASADATDPVSFISSSAFKVSADGRISASSALFSGSVSITGDVNAKTGTIGGFKITADAITGSQFFLSGSAIDNQFFISSSKFNIKASGDITASSALFSGSVSITGDVNAKTGTIGGFKITADAITGSQFFLSGSATGNQFFISSSKFNVKASGEITGSAVLLGDKTSGNYLEFIDDTLTVQGNITVDNIRTPATIGGSPSTVSNASSSINSDGFARFASASIAGFDIINSEIKSTNENLRLKSTGEITGSQVLFTGGKIAGWNIDTEKISNTGVHLSSSYGLKVFDGVDDGLDFVEMKYKASDNWGLVGKESGQEIFQLGNKNQIASWSFDNTKIISNMGVNSPTNPGIVIKSEGTIETDPFISGLTANATGWQIRADGRAEFENAVIRGTLSTAVFEKDTISVVGGQVMIANAAKVDNVNPRFTDYPYLKSQIGENINWSGEESPITASSLRSGSLSLSSLDVTPSFATSENLWLKFTNNTSGTSGEAKFSIATGSYAPGTKFRLSFYSSGSITGSAGGPIYRQPRLKIQGVYSPVFQVSMSINGGNLVSGFQTLTDGLNVVEFTSSANWQQSSTHNSAVILYFTQGSGTSKSTEDSFYLRDIHCMAISQSLTVDNAGGFVNGEYLVVKSTDQGPDGREGFVREYMQVISTTLGSSDTPASGTFDFSNATIDTATNIFVTASKKYTFTGVTSPTTDQVADNQYYFVLGTNPNTVQGKAKSLINLKDKIVEEVLDIFAMITGSQPGALDQIYFQGHGVGSDGNAYGVQSGSTQVTLEGGIDRTKPTLTVERNMDARVSGNERGYWIDRIKDGQSMASQGAAGTGYILLNAQPTDDYTPYIDIVERQDTTVGSQQHTGDDANSVFGEVTTLARIGDLSGITDYNFSDGVSGYGIYTSNGYFKGKVEVSSLPITPPSENLIFHLPLDGKVLSGSQGSGSFPDLSGNNYHDNNNYVASNIWAGKSVTVNSASAKIGGSAVFTATAGDANRLIYKNIPLRDNHTFAAWVKIDSSDTSQMLFAIDANSSYTNPFTGGSLNPGTGGVGADDQLDLWFNGNAIYWNTGDSTYNPFRTQGDTANVTWQEYNNTWTHFAVVNNSSTLSASLYINGKLTGSAAYRNPTTNAGIGDLTVGGYVYDVATNYNFKGEIDDFRIYTGSLSSKQVESIYLSPDSGTGRTIISGDSISTGHLRSNNWGPSFGSEFNLNSGTFKLGGSTDPKLSWNGSQLVVKGQIQIQAGSTLPDGATLASLASCVISSDTQIFAFDDSNDITPTPSTATITVQQANQLSDIVSGDITVTNGIGSSFSHAPGTSTGTGTATVTVTPDGTGTYPITVTVDNDGITDTITLHKVQGGTNAYSVILSNEAHTLVAGALGTVSSYAGSGTTISVYKGVTELDSIASGTPTSGEFLVTATGIDITPNASPDTTGNPTVFGDASAMDANNASISFAVNIEGVTTITKVQSFAKSIQGATGNTGNAGTNGTNGSAGEDARAVNLTCTDQVFTYDTSGATPDPADTTITATALNTTGTVYYEFFVNDSPVQNLTQTTYEYTPQVDFTNMPDKIEVQIREGADDSDVLARDQLTISAIKPGANGDDAMTIILSNEAHTLPTDNDGNVTYTDSGTTIQVFEGATELVYNAVGTSASTWTVTGVGSNITTGTITDSGDYATVGDHTSMTANTALITYTITGQRADGTSFTFTKSQSFAKSIQGATGNTGNAGSTGPVGPNFGFLTGSLSQVTPTIAAGLLMTDEVFGYHTGIDVTEDTDAKKLNKFTSLLDNIGNFYLGSGSGAGHLTWENATSVLTVSGTINATAGNIGGFKITADAITGSQFFLSGSAIDNQFFISSSKFNVKASGDITASSALFSGSVSITGDVNAKTGTIGGFGITADAITGSQFFLSGSATGNQFFISSSKFNVKASGDITGSQVLFTGGKIGGFTIDGTKLKQGSAFHLDGASTTDYFISSSNFQVTPTGHITGSQVLFTGGKVGGFTLSSTAFTAGGIVGPKMVMNTSGFEFKEDNVTVFTFDSTADPGPPGMAGAPGTWPGLQLQNEGIFLINSAPQTAYGGDNRILAPLMVVRDLGTNAEVTDNGSELEDWTSAIYANYRGANTQPGGNTLGGQPGEFGAQNTHGDNIIHGDNGLSNGSYSKLRPKAAIVGFGEATDADSNGWYCGVMGFANNADQGEPNGSAGGQAIAVWAEANSATTTYSFWGNRGVLWNRDEIRSAVDVIAYASDKRLKENILIIEDPIEKIKRLRGVHFDWNELSKEEGFEPSRQKNEIGVIAQELEAVIPQAVYDAPFDHQTDLKKADRERYKTVKLEKIVPLLIEGIKEQQKQIESLEARIKKLENK
jgi:hypothetical protein